MTMLQAAIRQAGMQQQQAPSNRPCLVAEASCLSCTLRSCSRRRHWLPSPGSRRLRLQLLLQLLPHAAIPYNQGGLQGAREVSQQRQRVRLGQPRRKGLRQERRQRALRRGAGRGGLARRHRRRPCCCCCICRLAAADCAITGTGGGRRGVACQGGQRPHRQLCMQVLGCLRILPLQGQAQDGGRLVRPGQLLLLLLQPVQPLLLLLAAIAVGGVIPQE